VSAAERPPHLRVVEPPPGRFDDGEKHTEPLQIPPHDLDAEAAVISCALIDRGSVKRVRDYLRPEHFYAEAHRVIWQAILEEDASPSEGSEHPDIVLVMTRLRNAGRLEQAGGSAYLTLILNSAPAVANVSAYAVKIYDLHRAREALVAAQTLVARCYLERGVDAFGEVQPFLDDAAKVFAKIARRTAVSRFETNAQTFQRIIEDLARRARGDVEQKPAGIATGYPRYDQLTRGLHPGEKTVVVALPKVGKTAFASQVAVHVAKQGVGVLYLSQEVARQELLTRMAACESHVSFDKLRTGALSSAEWSRLTSAVDLLASLPIWIDDTPDMHIDQVRGSVHVHIDRARAERKVPLGLYVLDYIQRLSPAPGEDREKEHTYLARAAKKNSNMARELGIACIELAQRKAVDVDRVTKMRPAPGPGCTAQSSQIEREAHAVVYLHRNPAWAGGRVVGEDPASVTLTLGLQRGGAEGSMRFEYEGSQYRFTCLDAPEAEQEEIPPWMYE